MAKKDQNNSLEGKLDKIIEAHTSQQTAGRKNIIYGEETVKRRLQELISEARNKDTSDSFREKLKNQSKRFGIEI